MDTNFFEENLLSDIEKHQLSAVTFVMDYLQLGFDGDLLTILTTPKIDDLNGSREWLEPGFRDKICGFITKIVQSTTVSEKEIIIKFVDDSKIIIPLSGASPGKEAVIFRGQGKKPKWWVLHQITDE
jgi:hypothetical protein